MLKIKYTKFGKSCDASGIYNAITMDRNQLVFSDTLDYYYSLGEAVMTEKETLAKAGEQVKELGLYVEIYLVFPDDTYGLKELVAVIKEEQKKWIMNK